MCKFIHLKMKSVCVIFLACLEFIFYEEEVSCCLLYNTQFNCHVLSRLHSFVVIRQFFFLLESVVWKERKEICKFDENKVVHYVT